jgi:hypothetical protein
LEIAVHIGTLLDWVLGIGIYRKGPKSGRASSKKLADRKAPLGLAVY